jgi:ring-1,2-phenylacetyl-CoA epoxidase subunit PaaE
MFQEKMSIIETTSAVKENTLLNEDTSHLVISGKLPRYQAGQFLMLGEDGKDIKRAYSIASAPWEENIALCIRAVENGAVSPKIFAAQAGEQFSLLGPYGHCTITNNSRDIVFLAVGTGIAPYRGMIRDLFQKQYSGSGENTRRKIRLLFGAKVFEDIFYEEEFTKLAQAMENFEYTVSLTREENPCYLHGRLPVHIDQYLDNKENSDFYICGGNQMVQDMKKLLMEKGVAKENIFFEIHGVRTGK